MRYHNIIHDDMRNGDGLRVTLFLSGCTHKCQGCHNPETWDKDSGIPFDTEAKKELFTELSKPYIDGITLSGGDPLSIYNRDEVLKLICEIKAKFPDKTIWVYTGFTKEELQADYHKLEQVSLWDLITPTIDVIVTGRFIEALKNINYEWAGSTNQEVLRKESNFCINTSKISKDFDDEYNTFEPDCCP